MAKYGVGVMDTLRIVDVAVPALPGLIGSEAGVNYGSGVDLVEKFLESFGEDVVVVAGDHVSCCLYVDGLGVGHERQHVCESGFADDV